MSMRDGRERRTVGIVGFGMIGSSLGRALASRDRSPGHDVVCWDIDGTAEREAERHGITWAQNLKSLVAAADVIFACTPLGSLATVLADIVELGRQPPRARPLVITDVGSSKGRLPLQMADLLKGQNLVTFVSSHPMAGVERSGFEAGDPDLFQDATWALCTDDASLHEAAIEVARVVLATGANVIALAPSDHDQAVAAVSQVPVLLAAAQTLAVGALPEQTIIRALAASGFRDSTRVAAAEPEISAAMMSTNPEALLRSLQDLASHIASLTKIVETSDWSALLGQLGDARDWQSEWRADRPDGVDVTRSVAPHDFVGAVREATDAGHRLTALTSTSEALDLHFSRSSHRTPTEESE